MEKYYICYLGHVLRSLLYVPFDALVMFVRKNHRWNILESMFDMDEMDDCDMGTYMAVADVIADC